MNLKRRPSWDAKLWSFCLIILQTNNLKEHKRFSFPLDLKKTDLIGGSDTEIMSLSSTPSFPSSYHNVYTLSMIM